MNFRTVYVVAIVLTLLFGIGLGYQIHSLTGDDNDDTAEEQNANNSESLYPSAVSAKPLTEIYVRTGQISAINGNSIAFLSYVQNTDASYSKTTLTALVNDQTTFSKLQVVGGGDTMQTISLDDLKAGDNIAVQSESNIYGKTEFTASSVQLHEY